MHNDRDGAATIKYVTS